jgi:putative phosphoribosyl transferase
MFVFEDRQDAGRKLAALLQKYRGEEPLVLGLPRGGVPVAFEIAQALGTAMDVWVVRKIGAPMQPELGVGAVAEGGGIFVDHLSVELIGASESEVTQIAEREKGEVERRVRLFRGGRPPPQVKGRTIIVVDDGIATGGTARAALQALRKLGPKRLILAVPVAATETLEALQTEVDEMVCCESTPYLGAIGSWYEDFSQVSDDEVAELLRRGSSSTAVTKAVA